MDAAPKPNARGGLDTPQAGDYMASTMPPAASNTPSVEDAQMKKQGLLRMGGLVIPVTVMDEKGSYAETRVYGEHKYLVEPISGSGTKWVSADMVDLFPGRVPCAS